MKLLISVSADKSKLPWAVNMLKVVYTVTKLNTKEMSSQNGSEISLNTAKKIIEAFNAENYQPYEQIDDFWVIESLKDKSVGISIDRRSEMGIPKGKAIIQFYTEE